ncbi:MAG: YggS family pyridoxal phosphate-dependent enzyme [Melioribacteraceae bacterium]|nr:MAG: YggS family pyridoxal phosphate-dependent enzyme [Melioribacteraceae bacterium]
MLKENLHKVEENISKICRNTGRNRSEIRLIAVSKTHTVEEIKEVINAGVLDFGENKAQELSVKSQQLKEPVFWHFIGHLQTNKVKYIIEPAEYIHSVDSTKLAEEINKRAKSINKIQKILLEINTSDEESKFGLTEEKDILNVAEFCSKCENVELTGLMTMAPYTDDKKIIRECFIKLRNIKDSLNQKGFNLKELSMGMTNDYEIAIEEGATMIRVGTAIFGERDYSKSWKDL